MAGERKATRMLQRVSKLLLLVLPLLLASCGGTVFHEFRAVDGSVWNRHDTLRFCYDGSFDGDVSGYNLSLEARADALADDARAAQAKVDAAVKSLFAPAGEI